MGILSDGIVTVQYPDRSFVFNPIPVVCDAMGRVRITVLVYRTDPLTGVEVARDTRIMYEEIYGVTFDLSAVAQGMFASANFALTNQVDNQLLRTYSISVSYRLEGSSTPVQLGVGSMQFLWGARQIGQEYKHYTRLTYFSGYPFTAPLLLFGERPEAAIWYSRTDEGGYEQRGTLGNGKYNLEPTGSDLTAQRRIVYRIDRPSPEWEGIFDDTFDHTFRGFTPYTFFIYLDVLPCRPDGVYLRWIGRQGERFYYLFKEVSRSAATTDRAPVIEQYYEDALIPTGYNYHPGTGGAIGKNEQITIALSAPLIDKDHYDYVSQIVGSPVVDLMIDNPDGTVASAKWVRVNISPGTFARNNDVLQDFNFNMLLPVTQNQYR